MALSGGCTVRGPVSKTWTNPFDPIDGVNNDGNGYEDDVRGWDFDPQRQQHLRWHAGRPRHACRRHVDAAGGNGKDIKRGSGLVERAGDFGRAERAVVGNGGAATQYLDQRSADRSAMTRERSVPFFWGPPPERTRRADRGGATAPPRPARRRRIDDGGLGRRYPGDQVCANPLANQTFANPAPHGAREVPVPPVRLRALADRGIAQTVLAPDPPTMTSERGGGRGPRSGAEASGSERGRGQGNHRKGRQDRACGRRTPFHIAKSPPSPSDQACMVGGFHEAEAHGTQRSELMLRSLGHS
jgi:hypothetical protein